MESAYVTSKGQLVIPARLRRRYDIRPGTKICFIERENEILFQPVTKEYIRSVCGLLNSTTLVTGELIRERAKDKQREEGKFESRRTR
jgi:AbrB family looped-hinge helix DNA binding protein